MKKLLLIIVLLLTMVPLKVFSETELPNEPGTYPIKVSYVEDGKELFKTVYVTVRSEDTEIIGDVAIDAKAFLLTTHQVEKITAREAIDYSGARAWSIVDVTVSEVLLNNPDFNSSKIPFESSYWQVQLVISIFLAQLLAIPLLLVLFSSRNIVQIVQELTDFFSR
ncbi:hypothetical protein [Enterococcus hulanensis]|uniref:hypothetical protein n=1 Tax=Enterococcus hulanensis TaxID=2559929 RepID=UPI0010F952A2|nr:hypothetical protein [Enterococcus hulanensis]